METLVAEALAPRRTNTSLVGVFGMLALTLATIGVYGALARSVAQRTREIGLRMALGAARRTVLLFVVWQGLRLVVAGTVLGLVAAIATTRYLEGMLYEITPRDPSLMLTVAGLMIGVGLAASFLPARRAAGANPLTSLRSE